MALTKKQHFVPQVYLKAWLYAWDTTKPEIKQLKTFNKKKNKEEFRNTEKILTMNYFYEENKNSPDNKFENWLGEIENSFNIKGQSIAAYFEKFSIVMSNQYKISKEIVQNNKQNIDELFSNFIREMNIDLNESNDFISKSIKEYCVTMSHQYRSFFQYLRCTNQKDIFDNLLNKLKEFMAVQYVRTPSALERVRKQFGLEENEMNAFNMLKAFETSSLKQRISELNVHIIYIPILENENLQNKYRFYTNDNPCVDEQINSKLTTYFGAQIGTDDVFMMMPLSPFMVIVLFPRKFRFQGTALNVPFVVKALDKNNIDDFVNGYNKYIENTAQNVVIY